MDVDVKKALSLQKAVATRSESIMVPTINTQGGAGLTSWPPSGGVSMADIVKGHQNMENTEKASSRSSVAISDSHRASQSSNAGDSDVRKTTFVEPNKKAESITTDMLSHALKGMQDGFLFPTAFSRKLRVMGK